MNGNNQQAYDRGSTIFSPDGRLYQVEYAREAVKRGSASIGIRTENGIVFAAEINSRSTLIERDSVEKLHKADNHIGIASAGHVADARHLIDTAREQAQMNQLRYGDTIGVETLTKQITDYLQQSTQTGGTRPFGVSLLIGGVHDTGPRLYEVDPSGTPYEWKACAVGGERDELQQYLEQEYSEDMSLSDGKDLAMEAIASINHDELTADEIALAVVTTDDEQYTALPVDMINERLDELDLLADTTTGDSK